MPKPIAPSRYERRCAAQRELDSAALPGRLAGSGSDAPGVTAAPGRVAPARRSGQPPAALGVQLELGCPADVLLSDEASRAWFGADSQLDQWAAFLHGYFPGGATFATFTYSDKGAAEFLPYRPAACFGDVRRFLTGLRYSGPAFMVCEDHRWRDVLHVHGLIHDLTARERVRVQEAWYAKRGRARLLPATAGAFPYVCKYALKRSGDRRGDFLDLTHLPSFVPWGETA